MTSKNTTNKNIRDDFSETMEACVKSGRYRQDENYQKMVNYGLVLSEVMNSNKLKTSIYVLNDAEASKSLNQLKEEITSGEGNASDICQKSTSLMIKILKPLS